jgi:uncharacterized protein DUF2848
MSPHSLEFTIEPAAGEAARRRLEVTQAVIAGWTGRDPVARDKHIAELELLGVPRPATTPIFYRVSAARLTITDAIECAGMESSGEVEFVLLRAGGQTYVGVGSDHTDRKVETYSITVSKQMCDKPLAGALWLMEDIAPHWDQLMLRAFATIGGERRLYQEGPLSGMLAPGDLIARGFGGALPEGTALFGGTFAAKGGIRPAARFDFEMEDPVLKRTIRGGYDVVTLPVVG